MKITDPAHFFLTPASPKHRQYEALRACFVDCIPVPQVARQFGYVPGSLHVLCSKFRKNPSLDFFTPPSPRTRQSRSKPLHDKILALRKQNLSIYDIAKALAHDRTPLTPAMISRILAHHGFAKLPRRSDDERPSTTSPIRAEKADVQALDLAPRSFHTSFGGLFLFLPYLARIPLERLLRESHFPGSQMLPACRAVLSLLALKLVGKARKSHVMSAVLDPGLALFAGLNVIPKRSFLTEYSCRIDPSVYPRFMRGWFDAVGALGLERGRSFDLDFHTTPFHGEDALIEKHYVSKRSRRQNGILAFLARDTENQVFCYANAQIRKADQASEIMRFIDFWKERTGHRPEELVFDSKLTTYAHLDRINQLGIRFITLRRRSIQMVHAIQSQPLSAWRQIELPNVARQYRTPRILDEQIQLSGYNGPLRQLTIADLGHEDPTLLLTNHLKLSAPTLITRYAQRMIIENQIADGIDFFHMDALSSAVPMKVNCDLQLTLMASSLYRLMACDIGQGYERVRSRTLFDNFVDASARVAIDAQHIHVHFQKRAHNPYLIASPIPQQHPPIPWLGNKKLNLILG